KTSIALMARKSLTGEENLAKEDSLRITVDPQPFRRYVAIEETGDEHFERAVTHDEKILSLLQRVDYGQTIQEDDKKESQPVQDWQWKIDLHQNLDEAQRELGILIDVINNVQGNYEVNITMMHRSKQPPDEELEEKALCLTTKLQSFNHVSKYLKQSARSLSQQVSREATFYGALLRLQHNWKVRQKKDRTAGSGRNAGFIIVLSDDALTDPRLSFRLLSMCTIDLDQDSSGMLTANLSRHARLSLHVRYNNYQSGRHKWEYVRKKNSSTSPTCNIFVDRSQIRNQETEKGLAKVIVEGVDEGSKRAHSNFRDILSEIFDAQVFGFLMREISDVKLTGIGENFLQFSLSPKTGLTVFLESSLSNKENEAIFDVEMTERDLDHSMDCESGEKEVHKTVDEERKNEEHGMNGETADKQTEVVNKLAKLKEKCPDPLSSEVYLQHIVHKSIFGLHSSLRDKGPTIRKSVAATKIGSGQGQETLSSNMINVMEHFCMTLSHRIYSYKVLDELEKIMQLQYLRLVSHPTWIVHTSVWFLYLHIPETAQTKASEWSDAQKTIRSQYYCKVVVHKELLTIEGGTIPCVGGLFTGTSTEVWSTNEYSCCLADLASLLLQQ
ncbi:hypothetical protein KI387_025817, partial [Taxus chinensis]